MNRITNDNPTAPSYTYLPSRFFLQSLLWNVVRVDLQNMSHSRERSVDKRVPCTLRPQRLQEFGLWRRRTARCRGTCAARARCLVAVGACWGLAVCTVPGVQRHDMRPHWHWLRRFLHGSRRMRALYFSHRRGRQGVNDRWERRRARHVYPRRRMRRGLRAARWRRRRRRSLQKVS